MYPWSIGSREASRSGCGEVVGSSPSRSPEVKLPLPNTGETMSSSAVLRPSFLALSVNLQPPCVHDAAASEISLDRLRVHAGVSKVEARCVPQHVRVDG